VTPLSRVGPGLVALWLVAACSGAAPRSDVSPDATRTTATEGENTSPTADAVAGPCDNAYLPVAEGNSWTYELSEPAGTMYTDTITEVAGSGFTVTTEFEELTKRTKWSCSDDGVTALMYGTGPAASLSVGGLAADFATTDVTGVTLPSDVSTGDRWRQTFDIAGRLDAAGVRTKVTGSVDYVLHAGDVQTVEVPAGTFEAIAIDTDVTLDLTPSTGGVGIPLTLHLDGVQWFAEDVGLVRSESEGDFFGASFSSVAELTSYDVG
jgi:hypothetical protein